jgi:Lectin C-type domain
MRTDYLHTALICLLASSCLRSTEYRCEGDTSCGGGGTCESTGFCSFSDPDCSSGRRYNASAGSLAGTCTSGGDPVIDADIVDDDSTVPPSDGSTTDTPVAQCPSGYNTITGGQTGHLYMFIANTATWDNQEAACQATTLKSHLVVPDDLAELTATDALAGGTNRYWIGITDVVTENTFVTVLGANAVFLPWDPPAPNNAGGEHCVEAIPDIHKFNDERCNTSLPAVCECAP